MAEVLISFLIVCLVLAVAWYLIGLLPDARLQQIARVIVIVIALIWLISHIRGIIHAVT